MSFVKLDGGIVNSSMWSESFATRVLWVTLLAVADEDGVVKHSVPGLQRAANMPMNDLVESLKVLESPDPYSRTPDDSGRRIRRIEDGWLIINYLKYRLPTEKQKEQTKERVRKYRERHNSNNSYCDKSNVTHCNVTETLPSASASASGVCLSSERGVGETLNLNEKTNPMALHATFLRSGPVRWLNWEYQSGQAWAFAISSIPGFNPEAYIEAAKKYSAYVERCGPDYEFTMYPHNWIRTGGVTVDWDKEPVRNGQPRTSKSVRGGNNGNNQRDAGRPGFDDRGVAIGATAKPGEYEESSISLPICESPG
jgi:hypothetical protein